MRIDVTLSEANALETAIIDRIDRLTRMTLETSHLAEINTELNLLRATLNNLRLDRSRSVDIAAAYEDM